MVSVDAHTSAPRVKRGLDTRAVVPFGHTGVAIILVGAQSGDGLDHPGHECPGALPLMTVIKHLIGYSFCISE